MKTFFAFALVFFAACTDDTAPTEDQDTTQQDLVCSSTAQCSPNAVCVKPNATSTSPNIGICVPTSPVPSTCSPDPSSTAYNSCPTGTRCNPICSTTGIAGYKCEPAGVPTKVCPVACTPVPSSTAGTCGLGHLCVPVCATATGSTTTHICVPASSTPPICL